MFKIRTLEPGDLIITPTETFEVYTVHDDGGLALQKRDSAQSLHMSRQQFEQGYAKREITFRKMPSSNRYLRILERRLKDTAGTEKCPKMAIRRLLLIEFDQAPVGLSDNALRSVINAIKLPPELAAIQWRPSPGTLRRDIHRYGSVGSRPSRLLKRRAGNRARRVDDRVAQMLDTTVKWYYQKRHREITDAFVRLRSVTDYLNERATRKGAILPALRRISYETVRWQIRKSECYEYLAQKYGDRIARERYVGINPGREAKRPLDVVMIDATVIDTILVFANDSSRVLGRPTITIAIDVCTRMIVGMFISFEPPSIFTVSNCIKHMLTPKEPGFREKYPGVQGMWHAYGKPFQLILDNGIENVGSSLQDTLIDLGINVEWAPVGTPQYKAIVERFFHTLNKQLLHKLPGGLPGDIKARRDLEIDPAKMACLTLDELEELVCGFIVDVYQNVHHRGADFIPLQQWKTLVRKYGIDTVEDLREIDEASGYVKNANLTREGVKTEGLRFHEAALTTGLLRDLQPTAPRGRKSAPTRGVPVKIKFDPNDISAIHVWNDRDRSYVRLPNVQKDYAAATSLWLHRTLTKLAKDEQLNFISEEDRIKARRRLLRKIESAGNVSPRVAKRISAQMEHKARLEVHVAQPRHDGYAESVPVETGMNRRADGGARPDGYRRGGKKRLGSNRKMKMPAPPNSAVDAGVGDVPPMQILAEDPERLAEKIRKSSAWN